MKKLQRFRGAAAGAAAGVAATGAAVVGTGPPGSGGAPGIAGNCCAEAVAHATSTPIAVSALARRALIRFPSTIVIHRKADHRSLKESIGSLDYANWRRWRMQFGEELNRETATTVKLTEVASRK
jgi:hypothetical protein